MKLRTLSLVLIAACGGGGDGDDVVIQPDGPPGGDGPPPGFANSKNDVYYFNPTAEMGVFVLTPQAVDQPDNQASPLALADTGGSRFGGEMGIGGDHGDEYFERDTYLIHTGANVNQITVRTDWDGGTADIDYVLTEELAAGGVGDDIVVTGFGLRIGDDGGEFDTFNVKPDTNYWLWAGVYNVTAAGGAPTLPRTYDISVYGDSFDVADIGACSATEGGGNDATNDILTLNGEFDPASATGTAQTTAEAVTTATTNVFCGSIASTHFQASPTAGDPGVVDSDAFTLTVGTATPVLLTLSGVTAADQTALAALTEVDFFILNTAKDQSFGTVTFINTHGVLTAVLDPSLDGQGADTGPRTIAMVALADAAITTPINYKLTIAGDNRDTRAPRITSGGVSEANDL
jgi:hypothetical protein